MKKLHTTKLIGLDDTGEPVKSHNSSSAVEFVSQDKAFQVIRDTESNDSILLLITSKGTYVLKPHKTQNYYYATCNGIKVQVTLRNRAMQASLRAWY
jgi:hypothetical protein